MGNIKGRQRQKINRRARLRELDLIGSGLSLEELAEGQVRVERLREEEIARLEAGERPYASPRTNEPSSTPVP